MVHRHLALTNVIWTHLMCWLWLPKSQIWTWMHHMLEICRFWPCLHLQMFTCDSWGLWVRRLSSRFALYFYVFESRETVEVLLFSLRIIMCFYKHQLYSYRCRPSSHPYVACTGMFWIFNLSANFRTTQRPNRYAEAEISHLTTNHF